jgi:hypothetical protein
MRTAVKLLKLFCAFATFLVPTSSFAQYIRTDLVSNTGTVPNPADLDLVNGWGLVSTATSPFWVSDNGTGKSTLYAVSNPPQGPTATKQGLIVTIPAVTGTGQGTPTGIVANESASTSTDFTVTDPISHKSGREEFGGKFGKGFCRLAEAFAPPISETSNANGEFSAVLLRFPRN